MLAIEVNQKKNTWIRAIFSLTGTRSISRSIFGGIVAVAFGVFMISIVYALNLDRLFYIVASALTGGLLGFLIVKYTPYRRKLFGSRAHNHTARFEEHESEFVPTSGLWFGAIIVVLLAVQVIVWTSGNRGQMLVLLLLAPPFGGALIVTGLYSVWFAIKNRRRILADSVDYDRVSAE